MDKTNLIDNRYKILQELGAGLSGEVYAVEDDGHKKALKFLKKVQFRISKKEALDNFKSEFAILKELNHPGIARIFDFEQEKSNPRKRYYFTTELIEGRDLYKATKNQTIATIEDLAVQILRALNYLHSRAILHLDIKPQNILIETNQSQLIAKLIDFGLSGLKDSDKKMGTPAYMAPEILLNSTPDGRTDLYSLGIVLYKCFTRTNPFASKDLNEILTRQKTFLPDKASTLNAEVPAYWDRILNRLLQKKPSDRYADAASVIRDINFLSGKNYEIETLDTRLSYLPEKGQLIARNTEIKTFQNLFNAVFKQQNTQAKQLLIIAGDAGTGKSRLINEFKYHSQLNDIHIYTPDDDFSDIDPPYLVLIDDASISADTVNEFLQIISHQPILIVWATEQAPQSWSQCEVVTLTPFSESELSQYLASVLGLDEAPPNLVSEIYQRTHGNPLFVTELVKTLMANQMLTDASGRWDKATFKDIGINFDKINIPQTLSGLLANQYQSLNAAEQNLLQVLAIANHNLDLNELTALSTSAHPQTLLLNLTQADLTTRHTDGTYFFKNILLRQVVLDAMGPQACHQIHDQLARYYQKDDDQHLFHQGHGSQAKEAVTALLQLSENKIAQDKTASAIDLLTTALARAQTLDAKTQAQVKTKLAEAMLTARRYTEARAHFEDLQTLYNTGTQLQSDTSTRIQILEKLGDVYAKLKLYDQAFDLFKTALANLDKTAASEVNRLIIKNNEANVYMKSGQLDTAEKMFRDNLAASEKLAAKQQKLITNNFLADVYLTKKDYTNAEAQIKKDLKFYQSINDRFKLARSAYLQGELCQAQMLAHQGQSKINWQNQARQAFDQCVELTENSHSFDMRLRAFNGLGSLAFYDKNFDQALTYYQRALALARKLEDHQSSATLSLNIANIYQQQKKFDDAYSYYIYAINMLENMADKHPYDWGNLFNLYAEVALTYMDMNDTPKGLQALNRAQEILDNHDHLAGYQFYIWARKAKLYHLQNQASQAQECLNKAKELAQSNLEIEELKEIEKLLNDPTEVVDIGATPLDPTSIETILTINQYLNSEHNLNYLLKMVLQYALDLTQAEAGLVLLINDKEELEVLSALNTTVDDDQVKYSTSIAKQVLKTGQPLSVADAGDDDRFDQAHSIIIHQLKSVLCLPLQSRNKVIGVLYLDNRFKLGAFDQVNHKLLKAYCDQVGIAVENARLITQYKEAQQKLTERLDQTTQELSLVREQLEAETTGFIARYSYDAIISKSKPMREVFKVLDKVTETNLAVLINGPSGTGKELIAKALHYNNTERAEHRFVAINCGAIPANLMESELFGYKAGSFTGATKDHRGLIEEADGGTLFLDEIGEMPLNLQPKLLRVLQESEVQRIGGAKPIKVNVRIVCATHQNIEAKVKRGEFREDLFFRLCQMPVNLPPLAARKEDIPLLIKHFVDKYREENSIEAKIEISSTLMKACFQYAWPGNIRELENVVSVACALRTSDKLTPSCIPHNYGLTEFFDHTTEAKTEKITPTKHIAIDPHNTYDPNKKWDDYEKLIIAKCFAANNFKRGQTAKMLGVSPSTLYKKIKEFDLNDHQNPLYDDDFVYEMGLSLKQMIPLLFNAALEYADDKPYTAIRYLGVSQGYFYKIIKGRGAR